ncbi:MULTISPECIES: hypothetical protein [unclassified Streptomyces]|uniref:hypothetical protein n=1 Tax=unclassified Streptomyces TaxID=2593676 RepID=UPI003804F84E
MAQYRRAPAEADRAAGLICAALARAALAEATDRVGVPVLGIRTGHAYVEVDALRMSAATTLVEALPSASTVMEKADKGSKFPAASS